jgi:sec-independent protein translocase protein TatC
MTEEHHIPFHAHLEELRTRLIRSFIAIAVGFIISYAFREQLFEILTAPLRSVMPPGDKLIFTGLPEAFFTYLKAAFLSGIFLAVPYITYEFWMFISPGLYHKEKRVLIPVILLSSLFFLGGAFFGYFVVFPYGFTFFLSFSSESLQALPSMSEYLSFSSKLLIAFGLVFELPLVLTSLARLGVVTVPFLKKNRKYALLIFFAGAAILTPPDVVTQIMMAFPLMLLYEVSIIGAKIFGRKKSVQEDISEENKPGKNI